MDASEPLADDVIVAPLPHYHLSGNALKFLISNRSALTLTAPEAAIWEAIRAGTSMGDLRGRHGMVADEVVARFLNAGVCQRAVIKLPSQRRRILVIEPHSDDAALSVGATMWTMRNEAEFTLLTVASKSNFTSYWHLRRDYFDVEGITALRNAEAALFVRCVGGHHYPLGMNEASLRYQEGDWSLDWFNKHEQSIYLSNIHCAPKRYVADARAALKLFLEANSFHEIWMPMGIGPHSDHELTRNACLALFIDEPEVLGAASLSLYQDVPYDSDYAGHADRILTAMRRSGAVLTPDVRDVDGAFEKKMSLLGIYASQFKLGALGPSIRSSAGNAPRSEHLWRVDRLPAVLDADSMNIELPSIESLSERFRAAKRSLLAANRIHVLSIMPAGQWQRDVSSLLDAFPRAQLVVHMSSAGMAETERFRSERLEVRAVGRGLAGWLNALVATLTRTGPLIVIVGPRHLDRARRLIRYWPRILKEVIVAARLDLCAAALGRVFPMPTGQHRSE